MPTEDTTGLIVQYLTSPEAKRPTIVNKLAKTPEDAFNAILGFRGPYPESLHPRDVHDTHLVQLLADLLRKRPHLFTDCDIKTVDRSLRHPLICAAIMTQDPRFTDGILTGLKDRSIYLKLLVVDAITRYKYLRTADAKEGLQRLLTVKSIAESDYDRDYVVKALKAFEK